MISTVTQSGKPERVLLKDSIPCSPILSKFIGRSAAYLLQQVHFWLMGSSHIIGGQIWAYNTLEEISDQTALSISTVKRAIACLRRLGVLLVERHEKHDWEQRNWYSIDYERLELLPLCIGPKLAKCSAQIRLLVQTILGQCLQTLLQKDQSNNNGPTTHPVEQPNGRESNSIFSGEPHTDLIEETAQTIAPMRLNNTLKRLIEQSDPDRVRNAIAAVRAYKQKQPRISNLGGLMHRAISEGWSVPAEDVPDVPDGFDEWFRLARAMGVVSASTLENGVMKVFSRDGWEDWGVMQSAFPLPKLLEMEQAITNGLKTD